MKSPKSTPTYHAVIKHPITGVPYILPAPTFITTNTEDGVVLTATQVLPDWDNKSDTLKYPFG